MALRTLSSTAESTCRRSGHDHAFIPELPWRSGLAALQLTAAADESCPTHTSQSVDASTSWRRWDCPSAMSDVLFTSRSPAGATLLREEARFEIDSSSEASKTSWLTACGDSTKSGRWAHQGHRRQMFGFGSRKCVSEHATEGASPERSERRPPVRAMAHSKKPHTGRFPWLEANRTTSSEQPKPTASRPAAASMACSTCHRR